ncbi:MAG: type 2 isopentenyl-diphosphate Delta-isomerase [Saprospiraceae bacterium]|nr:type 2 isopentenyl-diphosphate Delta-isomerase [Saprospiraceae bacterium]
MFSNDPTAETRKKDHIEMALRAQIASGEWSERFYYEPMLSAHPQQGESTPIQFAGKMLQTPIWVSSMTGGTAMAFTINQNLARACRDFGMGMGLGSCRSLLFGNERLQDFDVRAIMGDEVPLFANLGIAQVEQLMLKQEWWRITALIEKLQADGLIIHVNPMQEWLQPEGDQITIPPVETIAAALEQLSTKIIVKEVGQGMGYHSLKALFQLPLEAIDFAAMGGTNFAKLELMRSAEQHQTTYEDLAYIGHNAYEMVEMTNAVLAELGEKVCCTQVIISGGVRHFLDGYYLMNKLHTHCVYAQASGFLRHAMGDYEDLYQYVTSQVKGLALARAFLKVR